MPHQMACCLKTDGKSFLYNPLECVLLWICSLFVMARVVISAALDSTCLVYIWSLNTLESSGFLNFLIRKSMLYSVSAMGEINYKLCFILFWSFIKSMEEKKE